MNVSIVRDGVELRPSQERALQRLIRAATDRQHEAAGHEVVFTVELRAIGGKEISVTLRADIPTLPATNALRVLTAIDHYWHVWIGRMGKLTAASYPSSLKQFRGDTWLGIHIT